MHPLLPSRNRFYFLQQRTNAMAAAAAAAARRFSSSASTVTIREVRWSHKFTIDGCKASRKFRKPVRYCSKIFDVAGCNWRISCEPNAKDGEYISFFPNHDHPAHSSCEDCSAAEFKFTLLDQVDRSRGVGVPHCLKDDRFSVRCDITGIKSSLHDDDGDTDDTAGGATANLAQVAVAVPPSNLHEHLGNLLLLKQGTDAIINAGGESWDVHRWLLKVRCPVLDAELQAASERVLSGDTYRCRLKIQGMGSKVFEAMLHFLYTDALPKIGEKEAVPIAQGLIAAADRYKIDRLKLMCEEMLCKRVDMDTVVGSLAVAEKHGCHALKAACVELLERPGNLKAVMGTTEGIEKVKKADCAGVVLELLMKQLP
ncbi:unnamed protein product [Urochloa decumbens]|uniref:BTB domain-containing protein n=1 Tax=Urochloa decumbens TaxID=240449 RepID=A0ABC8WAZ0_9POAL